MNKHLESLNIVFFIMESTHFSSLLMKIEKFMNNSMELVSNDVFVQLIKVAGMAQLS